MKIVKKSEMSVPELLLNTLAEYDQSLGWGQRADIIRNILRWNHDDFDEVDERGCKYLRHLLKLGNLVITKICEKLSQTTSIDKDYIDLLLCIESMKDDIPFDMPKDDRIKRRWEDLALEYGED